MEFPQAAVAIMPLQPLLQVRATLRATESKRRAEVTGTSCVVLTGCASAAAAIHVGAIWLPHRVLRALPGHRQQPGVQPRCALQRPGVCLRGAASGSPLTRAPRTSAPQQAILLDIVLILPSLVESLFKMPSSGFGLNLYIALCALPRAAACHQFHVTDVALPQTTRCGCTLPSRSSTLLGAALSARRSSCRSWARARTSK